MAEAEQLYSSYIVPCIFNGFFCYNAIMLNIATIYAIRKTSSLPRTLKTCLLSLAFSDLGVGLLVQPLYIARFVMNMEHDTENNPINNTVYIAGLVPANLFSFASFFGVVALAADRFLAVHLHLRYQELVTHKRVVAVVVSIWVFSAFLTLIRLWIPQTLSYIIFTTAEAFCIIITALCYYETYLAAKRHTEKIYALRLQQVAQNGQMANVARLKKSAVGTMYVYIVFLICYLPSSCVHVAIINCGETLIIRHIHLYTATLKFINSSLNPLIYSWKMTGIRLAIMDIMRNIFSKSQLRKSSVN